MKRLSGTLSAESDYAHFFLTPVQCNASIFNDKLLIYCPFWKLKNLADTASYTNDVPTQCQETNSSIEWWHYDGKYLCF